MQSDALNAWHTLLTCPHGDYAQWAASVAHVDLQAMWSMIPTRIWENQRGRATMAVKSTEVHCLMVVEEAEGPTATGQFSTLAASSTH